MAGLLVFLAHPDDEFFCAGLISAVTHCGVPAHLVCWTGGEGGMLPKRRLLLGLPFPFHPRIMEMRRSASHLGATSLTFLRYIDPRPSAGLAAPAYDAVELKKKMADLIVRHQAEIVVTHGSNGDYGHPAHKALHQVLRELCSGTEVGPFPLLTFNAFGANAPEARFLNRNDSADCLLDSRPYRRKKLQVFLSHRTQAFALKSMIRETGSSLRELLHKTRYEGYRCWNEVALREYTLKKFQQWTGAVRV